MNRFWHSHIAPIFEVLRPGRILEIGADRGWNTRLILAYCRAHHAHLDIVDPAPNASLFAELADYDKEYTYHPVKSLTAIPSLEPVDLALFDGDHNWFTVYSELDLLSAAVVESGATPPVMLFHDCAWPYARRDMYYDPESLAPSQRHAFAYRGMFPGVVDLMDNGMNAMLANALHEGGPRNGVLTAIEDFIATKPFELSFYTLPYSNGLGILVPEARMTPALRAVIDEFFTAPALMQACVRLEADSMTVRAMLQVAEARLEQRTQALVRARELLAEQAALIEELRSARDLASEREQSALRTHRSELD